MKAVSLATFRTKLHPGDMGTVLVTHGQEIEGDEQHMMDLARNGLVSIHATGAREPAAAEVPAPAAVMQPEDAVSVEDAAEDSRRKGRKK